jgi:hypothetical protein
MERIVKKRACKGTQRISKNYFLSILPSRPDPTYVIEVKNGQQIRIDSINTIDQPLNLKNGLYSYKYMPIETLYPRKILVSLKDSDWQITSFSSLTREICFSIKGHKFSYVIPQGYFWK